MEPSPQARKILSELNYDFHAFSIDHFVDWIGTVRKRKLLMFPWSMPSGMFGAWMSDGDEPREFIFYRNDVSTLHQIHIQLHEIAHFLCGHPTKSINRKEIRESHESGVPLPFDQLVKLRSPEKTAYEFEAESLASLIQEQIIRNSQIEQLTKGVSSDKRVAEAFKHLGLS